MRHEENGMGWVLAHDQFIGKLMENKPMKDYIVEISGTFKKQLSITALNEEEAQMAVEDHPFTVDLDDIQDYEIESVYPE
jgi:hypothetical protein